ncbi:MAG: glycosyltransferase family 2 protein [Clostridiales bacterium]|nr:glycosyltransferase family 2 protein [Clostridiales bacterium]
MAEVTVVIPNYNGKTLLENCIKTLEQQSLRDFKLFVIDNGSTDGSTELTSEILDMEIVELGENTGFCKAVNLGIKKTKTPYVILLNNDTEAEPHFVEELLKGIKQSENIFSGSAMMLDFRKRDIIDNAGDFYVPLGWARARGKGKPASSYEKEADIFSSCGGAAIYRMELLQKTGLFDERHFAYLEDVDLGYRAKIMGYRNRYFPAAKVYHVGSATTGTRYNEKKVFLAARNSVFVVYKNMPLGQKIINLPFLLLGVLIKWLFFVKKGFGKEYLTGIKKGLRECSGCKKAELEKQPVSRYAKLEIEMISNIFRILFGK